MRAAPSLLSLVSLVSLTCGRSPLEPPPAAAAAPSDAGVDGGCVPTQFADACAAVRGATFASLAPGECGRCSPGQVCRCTWHVTFSEPNEWSWQHSDYGMAGTYSCAGNELTAVASNFSAVATYDASCDLLTWDGVVYRRGQ